MSKAPHLIWSPDFAKHAPGSYPERPERMDWAMDGAVLGLIGATPEPAPGPGGVDYTKPGSPLTAEEMATVHTRGYLSYLDALAGRGGGMIAIDTEASADSPWVGRLAAAAANLGCRMATENGRPALALVRPPGHHASPGAGSGFCLYNNVALAARLHQARGGGRVAIVDWDVHHGNGTQDVFCADPEVLYLSMHETPLYPYTGWLGETGEGRGRGTIVNLPLPGGLDDQGALEALRRVIIPCVTQYRPDLVIISAGQDGHHSDPMSSWRLTAAGYAEMTSDLLQAASAIDAPVCAVLEGGYTPDGLRLSVAGIASALADLSMPEEVLADRAMTLVRPPRFEESLRRRLDEIVAHHRTFWTLS